MKLSLDDLSNVNLSKKIKVYRNLRNKCFSVLQAGRVRAHVSSIYIKDCNFTVNQKARERVIQTKNKNVHAFISGFITNDTDYILDSLSQCNPITYNPYKYNSFVLTNDESSVKSCKMARLNINSKNHIVGVV